MARSAASVLGHGPQLNTVRAVPPVTADGLQARAWADHLLTALGTSFRSEARFEHPALSWARSGLMALTGSEQGPPQLCPVALTAQAEGALAALTTLAPDLAQAGHEGAQLLAERAAIAGHLRHGAISPGGSCRLLAAADGDIAVNLARDSDWALLPAWLEVPVALDWDSVAATVRERASAELVERAHLLGLAAAASPVRPLRIVDADAPPDLHTQLRAMRAAFQGRGLEAAPGVHERPLVIDLSSLWAGPLCAQLLQDCGAEVIKLESLQRPDGARLGPAAFFDLMNAGKRSVAIDFHSAQGRGQLRELLLQADIVIEASRPRALRQLGIDAEAIVRERGCTWISLSGYGAGEPQEHWIAYGDDAGVAAGLSAIMREVTSERLMVGDAIADPLLGLHAALLAWASWRAGGRRRLALSLVGVLRECLAFDAPPSQDALRARHREWSDLLRAAGCNAASPLARPTRQRAARLGEHTREVLSARGIAC